MIKLKKMSLLLVFTMSCSTINYSNEIPLFEIKSITIKDHSQNGFGPVAYIDAICVKNGNEILVCADKVLSYNSNSSHFNYPNKVLGMPDADCTGTGKFNSHQLSNDGFITITFGRKLTLSDFETLVVYAIGGQGSCNFHAIDVSADVETSGRRKNVTICRGVGNVTCYRSEMIQAIKTEG